MSCAAFMACASLDPVHTGHHHIEHREMKGGACSSRSLERSERFGPACCAGGAKPPGVEHLFQDFAVGRIIVYDEYPEASQALARSHRCPLPVA